MIYKPQFDSPGSDSANKKYDRVPDVDSVFSIHPPTGVLPPAEQMEFKITYAPPIVSLQIKISLTTIFFLVHPWNIIHFEQEKKLSCLQIEIWLAQYM